MLIVTLNLLAKTMKMQEKGMSFHLFIFKTWEVFPIVIALKFEWEVGKQRKYQVWIDMVGGQKVVKVADLLLL